ncbi:hypothetical protein Tco_0155878 [Tanacetum coccineum]
MYEEWGRQTFGCCSDTAAEWADDTTMSTYLVTRSPSSAIGFKTPIDMLGFFCWLASIKQEMLEPVKVKCIFLGYRKRYGYWKNPKKTVKNGQTRTRERKSTQKAERKLSKSQQLVLVVTYALRRGFDFGDGVNTKVEMVIYQEEYMEKDNRRLRGK